MSQFIIEGGRPLSGAREASGNKNAALPMLAASVLSDSPVTIRRLPLIRDVRVMLDLLAFLGAKVALDESAHSVSIDPSGVRPLPLDPALCSQVRTSILFAGPLLARFGTAVIPLPGGDGIGRRRLDTHFDGLSALGAEVDKSIPLVFRRKGPLAGADLVLDEASVTGTENIVMAASLAQGETSIYNAACEPHVQDLCRMINDMGGDITGIGTNRIVVRGVKSLHGTNVRVGPDTVEAASYIAAAAATGGTVSISGLNPVELRVLSRPFARLGVRWEWRKDGTLVVPREQDLRVVNDAANAIPKIEDGIWPMVPSDIMSALIVLSTRAQGTVLFFEKLFESRLYFIDRLLEMGARIVQCDPHRVLVQGPSPLHGTRVASPDIRAGMALVVAALCAEGPTAIHNAESIDRGYEDIEKSLAALGARITREE